jgi:hypothetical protein
MRALTIWQPYASRIIGGTKTVENRDWVTAYRGPLLIHAGIKMADAALVTIAERTWTDLPRGVIVGIVELVETHKWVDCKQDCWPTMPGAAEGRAHWLLARPRELPQISVRGMPGLWHPKPELLAALGIDDRGNVAGSTT